MAALPEAFKGIKNIGVIGWGSQAPAQAQNLKDSLEFAGMKDVKVSIGLRMDSPSVKEAEAVGFSKSDGTLGEVFDIIAKSDLVVLLISDGAQVRFIFSSWIATTTSCNPAACKLDDHHLCPTITPVPQAKMYPRLLAAMKPGATLGLSHGFLLGVMKNDNVDFRKDINVVLVAPKVPHQSTRSCTRLNIAVTTF